MAWWQTAKVGDFIACVNDDRYLDGVRIGNGNLDGLKSGTVYSIRAIGENPAWGNLAIWLNEIHRGPSPCGAPEIGYHVRRFRPVDPKRIEVFKAMLNPVPVDA